LTLTFSAAPPSGTGNISVRYLGIPASNIATTAYRTLTEFTATAGQTTFTPPSYTAGYITVLRNGVQLGTADFTATNGTTVVLATGATSGDLITTISFLVSSVLNAIPAVAGAVSNTYLGSGVVLAANMGANGTWAPAGTVLQVVNATYSTIASNATNTFADTGLTATITPKFATSKILVLVDQNGVGKSSANSGNGVDIRLVRNGSQIVYMNYYASYTGSALQNNVGSVSTNYLDSPATTSATIYKTQFSNPNNSATAYVQNSNETSTITLMEIAA
jgi:hypothetical protein